MVVSILSVLEEKLMEPVDHSILGKLHVLSSNLFTLSVATLGSIVCRMHNESRNERQLTSAGA